MLLERLVRSKSLCSRFVCVRGLRMHYRMGEPGQQAPSQAATPLPTVVLVHGQVVSSRYMEPLAEVLAERARVFVPDLPGFGLSAKPAVTLGMTSLAKYLAEWMGALSLPKAVVVGNSLGCQVAVELAVRHPERVSHLVLQGPTMDWRARAPAPQVARWLRAALHERPKLNLVMLMDLFSAGTRRAIGTFRMALDH
jgi:pimeloyl-ACP methyl ester carboxylesterase